MSSNILKPKQALSKAYLKVKPTRNEIELFKKNLLTLSKKIDTQEVEEHAKNNVRDFLLDTYYKGLYEINVKGRNDLVIHSDKTSKSSVSVIIEAKRPSNKAEFPTKENINVKATQELVLYYLRERVNIENTDIKNLVITNGYEWLIFDGNEFYKYFFKNVGLVKDFKKWDNGQKDSSSTDMFYKDIAKKYIEEIKEEIPFTYFNISDFDDVLKNNDLEDDKKLITLFKILSPAHLLKQSFTNDSNTLDKNFYHELLHIIGLEEVKVKSKKIIRRKEKPDEGSLIENTINILKVEDRMHKIENPSNFGETREEQYFGIALELCITWINRVLFLKLLEAQLLKYFKGNKDYKFLFFDNIGNYDALNKLFFQVLAIKPKDRSSSVKSKFEKIPYLNSSLFEINHLEDDTIRINSLEDDPVIPIISKTVLKGSGGKKIAGKVNTLKYLFDFLDAYDFSSEGSEDIQEESKTLVNASVLGLIFEKINGYKDGSFFTPGFITMYMAKETIRRAVIQKFNDEFKLDISDFDELKNFIGSPYKKEDIVKYNGVINSLKICDPAVGSGHFLVSALNEIIAVKSELNILADEQGNKLIGYKAFVENDELILSNIDTDDLFEYKPGDPDSQMIQEALFREKQTIIESCLFGVDINHNSVKICRLRLWIELLKNPYYTKESKYTELETLPNIDINIKCGNSLVSRFDLDADLSKALRKSKWNITSYRIAVQEYQNAKSKEDKRELEKLIDNIKSDFRTEISTNDPKQKKLEKLERELYEKFVSNKLIDVELSAKEKTKEKKDKQGLLKEIDKLTNEIKEIKESVIYKNAFEWRFEFPEVLDEKGNFVGFDVVIGNPPYFSISSDKSLVKVANKFIVFNSSSDIYSLFIELGNNIIRKNGYECLIVSNKWMRANYGMDLRKYLVENTNPIEVIDFGQNLLFESAIVHTNIILLQKEKNKEELNGVRFPDGYFSTSSSTDFNHYIDENTIFNLSVDSSIWNVIPNKFQEMKNKIENFKKLKEWDLEFYRGLLTGLNKAFVINGKTRTKLVEKDSNSDNFIKPILRGRDTRRFYCTFNDQWLINIPKGFTIKSNLGNDNIVSESVPPRYGNMPFDEAWEWLRSELPSISTHLRPFKEKAKLRMDKGDFWWELRACGYAEEFEKPKIIFSEIVSEPQFYYDEMGYYPEATVFFISGEKLKYLTALLNSKAVTFFFKTFYMGGELVGKIRYKKAFLEQTPIPVPDINTETKINQLVDRILEKKKIDYKADTINLEKEIDKLVYQLYGLTKEEIKIVEGRV